MGCVRLSIRQICIRSTKFRRASHILQPTATERPNYSSHAAAAPAAVATEWRSPPPFSHPPVGYYENGPTEVALGSASSYKRMQGGGGGRVFGVGIMDHPPIGKMGRRWQRHPILMMNLDGAYHNLVYTLKREWRVFDYGATSGSNRSTGQDMDARDRAVDETSIATVCGKEGSRSEGSAAKMHGQIHNPDLCASTQVQSIVDRELTGCCWL
ncbi:hypothetical protein F4775DRAFT_25330 [Biscogniauxia sp. FL1348]|nr:hypothetical protein F4775DRAFT_25330 [Biscogniauxia sp. FL1348]